MIAFLRDLFLKDFWLKLFSLALAILIWLTVSFAIHKENLPAPLSISPLTERTLFNLPVLVVSAAADVQEFRVDPNVVAVTVQGDSKLLDTLQSKDIRALVDLTGKPAPDGKLRAPIEVSTPAGVSHVKVVPPDVDVIFPKKS
ncbi:exported hypothetical protein [Verrucomicrobia bacterium]|nr:exported hypothetical protein [Verrucomicrobiota bacterium]